MGALILGAITLGFIAASPRASAQLSVSATTGSFCVDSLQFSVSWPPVNLDFPGQPFFADGNSDGIADLLQLRHATLPSLASDLGALATEAPAGLQKSLRTLAADVQSLASDPIPTSATQSKEEIAQVERDAPAIQRKIKALDCRDKVQPADSAGASGGTSSTTQASGSGKTAALVAAFAFVNFPLIRRVWRYRRRPHLKADGSRFTGSLRKWRVVTLTGRALSVQSESITSRYWSDEVFRTVTTTYETIRMALADGSRRDVQLVNFRATPSAGDVITVCQGKKRSRTTSFAVLNQTTRQPTMHLQNLFSLSEGGTFRQLLFIMSLLFGALITIGIAIFGGAEWLLLIWFGLLIMFVIGARRGAKTDLQPLWRRTSTEAQLMSA